MWNEQWSYKIDGYELNRNASNPTGNYHVQIPELQNLPEQEVILAPIDGDYPAFVRNQPKEANWTILIAVRPNTPADWYTELTNIQTRLSAGLHTLTVQARGMTVEATVKIVVKSMNIDYKQRLITVAAVVPNPTLA